jgi:hypothetical protein
MLLISTPLSTLDLDHVVIFIFDHCLAIGKMHDYGTLTIGMIIWNTLQTQ